MKKTFLVIFAAAAMVALTACNGKTEGGEAKDSTSVENNGDEAFNPYTFATPENATIADQDNVSYVLYPAGVKGCIEEKKDIKDAVNIYYSADGFQWRDGKTIVRETEIPNSLIIPIYKDQEAHKGDIVLTWWQSGSGMQRAIVTDDSNPKEPKVMYLDLSYKGDGSGIAEGERHANQALKPNSFMVLEDGKWQPGQTVAVKTGNDTKIGILVSFTDDKVIYSGFASKLAEAEKTDCTILPVKPNFAVGDNVEFKFTDSFHKDGKILELKPEIGRAKVKRDNFGEDWVSILELKK
ncbi:MAG: hypothetical protein J6Z41_08850 [Prevotella sp.]|nr:hypothetical protein [Prevotella sp.]